MAEGDHLVRDFMREVLPNAPKATREIAGSLVMETLSEVGASFSESARTPAEIKAYANAMADMFCAYVERLGHHAAV